MLFSLFQNPLLNLHGLSLLSIFGGSQKPLSQQCVHSPEHRDCWKHGFSINTDYEAEIPPGKLVEVHYLFLEVNQAGTRTY